MPEIGVRHLFFLLALAGWVGPRVAAHDPGLSFASLRLEGRSVVVEVTYARADLEPLLAAASPDDLARRAFEVVSNGAAATIEQAAGRLDDSGAVRLDLELAVSGPGPLSLRSTLLDALPRGHKQYLAVSDANGHEVLACILSSVRPSAEVEAGGCTEAPSSASGFFLLGVEHILTGYDHLLFLLGVLLVGASFRDAAKVITSFTAAHSITLALAALDVVSAPSRLVEPAIAASIAFVGVENLLRCGPGRSGIERRWMLTFAFGLIHGFGFAGALRGLGLGASSGGVLVPLACFNLGVEAGQLAVAALIVPCVVAWRSRRAYAARVAPVASALIALVGAFWLIERTL